MPPAQLYPGYLATQVDVLSSQSVALQVVDKLGLVNHPDLQACILRRRSPPWWTTCADLLARAGIDFTLPEEWADRLGLDDDDSAVPDEKLERYRLADQLLRRLSVNPTPDSSVIKLSYTARERFSSARAGEHVRRRLPAGHAQPQYRAGTRVLSWFRLRQLSSLRAELDAARDKYSEVPAGAGIVATDENVDVENARLTELSAQLAAAQAENHRRSRVLKQDLGAGRSGARAAAVAIGPEPSRGEARAGRSRDVTFSPREPGRAGRRRHPWPDGSAEEARAADEGEATQLAALQRRCRQRPAFLRPGLAACELRTACKAG